MDGIGNCTYCVSSIGIQNWVNRLIGFLISIVRFCRRRSDNSCSIVRFATLLNERISFVVRCSSEFAYDCIYWKRENVQCSLSGRGLHSNSNADGLVKRFCIIHRQSMSDFEMGKKAVSEIISSMNTTFAYIQAIYVIQQLAGEHSVSTKNEIHVEHSRHWMHLPCIEFHFISLTRNYEVDSV